MMIVNGKPFEIKESLFNLLSSKFNIITALNLRDLGISYDSMNVFRSDLMKVHQKHYSNHDRILISHMDTDYYDSNYPYGIWISNLIRTFNEFDIPLFTLIIITNHYGLKNEVNMLTTGNRKFKPLVIETLLSDALLGNYNNNVNKLINSNNIQYSGLCMMGQSRSHRNAMYNFINNESLINNVALSYNTL